MGTWAMPEYDIDADQVVCTTNVDVGHYKCSTRCCRSGIVSSLVATSLDASSLSSDGKDIHKCRMWFTMVDASARAMTSLYRAIALVLEYSTATAEVGGHKRSCL